MKTSIFHPGITVLLNLVCSLAYGQAGNNDKNGTDVPFDPFYYSAGITSLNPYTGNIHCEIRDLEIWGGVGEIPMVWMRYGNSRSGTYPDVYGTAHHWNSSFMYYMADSGVNVRGRKQVIVHYPEGGQNIFTQDSTDKNLLLPPPGVGRRIFKDGKNCILQMSNGFRYSLREQMNYQGAISFSLFLTAVKINIRSNTAVHFW